MKDNELVGKLLKKVDNQEEDILALKRAITRLEVFVKNIERSTKRNADEIRRNQSDLISIKAKVKML